jgi:hypothetical protein
MKITKNIASLVNVGLRSFIIVSLFAAATSCTPEETLVKPETAAPVADEPTDAPGVAETPSVTVSGAFIEYTDVPSCSDCTYLVPADASVVDGKELGIKPGDVICLRQGLTYKALEFVNVDGTQDNPIIVAHCTE